MRQERMTLKIKIFITLIAIALIAFISNGFFSRASLSFDKQRLARIDAHYEAAINKQLVAGAQAVIQQNGRIIYNKSWGYSDLAKSTRISDDTIFHIFSMTKPITSVAVMILFEEGKILLHQPIAKYIPELANLRVYDPTNGTGSPPTRVASRQPTVRDLLTHTAGFTYGLFDNSPVGELYRASNIGDPTKDLKHFVEQLGKLPLKFDPGTKWNYSVATDILGRLVEVASGQKFSTFLRERIFVPLDMVDTSFYFDPEKTERQAVLYSREGIPSVFLKDGFLSKSTGSGLEPAHESLILGYTDRGLFESGGAGLLSTTSDYLQFANMLLNDGELNGVRILSPNSIAMMRSDQVGSAEPLTRLTNIMLDDGIGFGLGFGTIKDQGLSGLALPTGSFFWGGAAGTIFWIDPRHELMGLFMTQVVPHRTTLREDLWGLTYQALVDTEIGKFAN